MSHFDPLYDGHTHTHWCPHGDGRPLREYLDQAVARGLRRYAVTEHIPLPAGFVDPLGPLECANAPETLEPYLREAEALREEYADRLEILIGLEIDYLGAAQGGWHEALLELLAPVWPRLDPAATLLSLHFIDDTVIDGTAELTASLIPPGGFIDDVHVRYYQLLLDALNASWRWGGLDLRPRRLGHLALPTKFQRRLPLQEPERVLEAALAVVDQVAAEGLELDLNTAGLDKPDCGDVYVPDPLLQRAVALGIPLVLGSDAHSPGEVGRHAKEAAERVRRAGGAVGSR